MRVQPSYINLPSQQRETAEQFMLGCILKSRIASGCETSGDGIDAATNIYLAHLLIKVISSDYHSASHRFVSLRATDVHRLVEGSQGDAYQKFFLYQMNADYILLFLSIFDELAAPQFGQSAWCRKSERAFEGYGQAYYSFAATYCRLAQQRATDLSAVLSDLSQEFGKYRYILQRVRHDYFDMLHRFTEVQVRQLMDQLSAYECSLRREELLDTWLDLYSMWLQSADEQVLQQLVAVAGELRILDPTIQLPSLTSDV